MSFEIVILRRAQKELSQLPEASYRQVRDDIRALADDPMPPGCRRLTGREGWRIRSGDYRVIYAMDDRQRVLTVLHIGHRRDVYR